MATGEHVFVDWVRRGFGALSSGQAVTVGLDVGPAVQVSRIEGRVALPDHFTPAAVPARPHQLRRVDELLRTSDGAYHWIRRRVLVATAPRPSVTLQFDQLADRRSPQ